MREDQPARYARMSSFELYLRTGLRLRTSDAPEVEVKFNPWHDPATGRFTSAQGGAGKGARRPDGSWSGGGFTGGGDGSGGDAGGSGTWDGGAFTGGGGGSFGGAGATGYWGAPAARPVAARPSTPMPAGTTVIVHRPPKPTSRSTIGDRIVTKNGYSFRIDAGGRTREVTGSITLGYAEPRSRAVQATAGGAHRLPTDEGGHYIAARFNGSGDVYNHFAQDRGRNRGEYRVLENRWAKAVASGHRVAADIGPAYVGTSKRPAGLFINVMTDGTAKPAYISNAPRRK